MNDNTKEKLKGKATNDIYKVLAKTVIMCRERTNFRRGEKFRTLVFNPNFANSGLIPTKLLTVESNQNENITEQFVSSIAERLVRILELQTKMYV